MDFVAAHGTATKLNDPSETAAIKVALGEAAYDARLSSLKSMVGHMMGAAGAISAAALVGAIQDNVVPPTINYHEPNPECDLDFCPTGPKSAVSMPAYATRSDSVDKTRRWSSSVLSE